MTAIIITPFLLALILAGVLADCVAPKHPKLLTAIYNLLDKIM